MKRKIKQTIDLIKSIQTKLTTSASLMLLTLVLMSGLALAQPTITNFTPASGVFGSSVNITGTGFNTTAAQNIVFFGATKAMVTAANTHSLTVTVPLGATYEYITVTNLAVNLTAYSAKPFIVTLAGSLNFEPKVDFATGQSPYSIGIGDLDGDSKPDLAVINYASNSLSIFRNTSTTGTVSFAPKVDFVTGPSPRELNIGDIDSDGKLDLAMVTDNNRVSVWRNISTQGNISFAPEVYFSTGSNPISVSIGDLDGDGKLDLAVANHNSANASVLRNTSTSGTVNFAPKIDFGTGSSPHSVRIGDIDGDSKPDLAVTNASSGTVSILRNISAVGALNFSAKVDYPTGSWSASVSIGDLNGDGKPDLAVANYYGQSLSVLKNTSAAGAVNFAPTVNLVTGNLPVCVQIGDMDGDGKPDLAVVNSGSNNLSIFKNTSAAGTMSFAPKVNLVTGPRPYSLSIGDIDGDGYPDMAVPNLNNATLSVLRQSATLCNAPIGLLTKSITASSANTKWDTVDCAVGYKFQYKIPWQTQWTTLHHNLDYPSKKLRSLLPSTKYLWRVKAKYANGTYSNNSAIATFTTLALRSGLEMIDGNSDLIVYPNPAADQLNLEFPFTEGVSTKITVLNTIGQTVLEQNSSDDLSTIQLNIQSLTQGLYVVTVINGDETFTARFIKE